MYEEIEPKHGRRNTCCTCTCTLTGAWVFVILLTCWLIGFFCYYYAGSQMQGQNPVEITAKRIGTICPGNISHILSFTHFDFENLILSGEGINDNGTINVMCGGVDTFIYPRQFLFTFEAETQASADPDDCNNSQIMAYHQYGHTRQVEFVVKELGHSWTWTLYPGKQCDRVWLEMEGGDCCFHNYTLNAVEIKSFC